MGDRYRLLASRSDAATFHHRAVPEPARPELWWHEPTAPALVLGSSQADSDVDTDACERAGVDVVRRRSGGGAVLLVPGDVVWLDVIVPTGSPDWSPDVHAQMVWLGHRLATVIASLRSEPGDIRVHEGAMVRTPWSTTICFDGLGAGEVLLDGRKLVGISQRRTRHAARLQCCWYSSYDPSTLAGLLSASVRPPDTELRPIATLGADVACAIPAALHRHLA